MNAPVPETSEIGTADKASKTATDLHPAIRVVAMILVSVVATAVCYFVVAGIGEVYPPPPELLNLGGRPSAADFAAARSAQRIANSGNAMVWLGSCGALLGGILSLSNGVLQRAGAKTAIGAVAGMIAGGGLGALSGKLAIAYHGSVMSTLLGATSGSDQKFMMMHGMTWGLIGIGCGIGCGLSHRTIEPKSVITAIVVAGVMGCVAGGVYPIVVGVVAPLASSASPIAASGIARIAWIGLASFLIALGIGRAS